MKHNKFVLLLSVFALVASASCRKNEEDKHHYDNKVYIAATSFSDEVRIEKGAATMTRSVNVGMAKPLTYDVKVAFRAAPELLDTYRQAYYDEDVELLPATHYDLSQAEATIRTGQIESDPLPFEFTNLDQLDLEKRYVLPVRMETVQGPEALQSARTLYYLFKEASLVNVVADINENRAWPVWKDAAPFKDMSSFTLEALVLGYAFRNESSISTIMGIEDCFLIRVGDTTIPKNQIQIAYAKKLDDSTLRGHVTNASLALQPNRWYHIAVTFDQGHIVVYLNGREKASADATVTIPGFTSVDFSVEHSEEDDGKPRCFWIGYSYDKERFLNGMIGEARVWNRALTADEIAAENHFYKVDPASDGLVAYWKFDDGKGNIIRDHTAYGNDLQADRAPNWVAVELPEKK